MFHSYRVLLPIPFEKENDTLPVSSEDNVIYFEDTITFDPWDPLMVKSMTISWIFVVGIGNFLTGYFLHYVFFTGHSNTQLIHRLAYKFIAIERIAGIIIVNNYFVRDMVAFFAESFSYLNEFCYMSVVLGTFLQVIYNGQSTNSAVSAVL